MSEPTKLVPFGKVRHAEPEAPPKPAPPNLAPPIGTPSPLPTGAAPKPAPPPARDEPWTAFPHSFWDDLAPTLEPVEVAILGHLLRLTVGFQNRPTCRIGLPKLAERVNVGLNTLRRAVVRLEARGLVRREDVANTGHNRDRGTVWTVMLAPPKMAPATTGRAKPGGATTAPMISEKTEEKTVTFALRAIGARLREIHRDYTPERLREAVRDAADGQGLEYTAADLTEALRGM